MTRIELPDRHMELALSIVDAQRMNFAMFGFAEPPVEKDITVWSTAYAHIYQS